MNDHGEIFKVPSSGQSFTAKNQLNLFSLGFVELCAKILQIMRNDFKDYARTFCRLCAPSKTLDFLHCLARSAALTLAEWIIASFWLFQVLIH